MIEVRTIFTVGTIFSAWAGWRAILGFKRGAW